MKVEIKIPSMGESISEATIGAVLKPSGTFVAADEEIIELETQKVNQMLYAPEEGVIEWNISTGDVVAIGQVIGTVDSEAVPQEAPIVQEEEKNHPPSFEPQRAAPKQPPKAAQQQPQSVASQPQQRKSVRLSKEAFIEEMAASKKGPQQPQPALPIQEGEPPVTRKKMSTIRKVIATRLVEVMQQTAMLTTFNEVDMTAIMALRDLYKEPFTKKHGVRLGFMSFFVKAVVSALKEHPEVNAYIEGDDIVYRNDYAIGIAVGTDRGLVVPVVRGCDHLSFADVERAIEGYAKKAREGGLTVADLTGGGFTITNGGVYGSLLSTPILNPPQSAILGMHKISKRPVVVDDEIVIRPMMYLALSYDHRIIDGKEAVSFLVHVKDCLEDPERLQLEV